MSAVLVVGVVVNFGGVDECESVDGAGVVNVEWDFVSCNS